MLDGDVATEVSELRADVEGAIVVHGSARLVGTLLENDLVDELRLMVFPIILGTGKRLFAEADTTKRLRLTRSHTVGDGIVVLVYERP